MDRQLKKQSFIRRNAYYIAGSVVLVAILVWLVFGSTASTMTVKADDLTISDVIRGKFDDYVRMNAQVVPIQVVQISPEEGGIVREKVAEEGSRVHKGDVILRLSNSNLDLQILNAEAELAEKQNLLRNTQVTMQQDRLNNRTEQASLDMDCERKHRAYVQNERLYKERLISRETYIQSKEDYNLARRKQSLVAQRLKQDSIYRTVQMAQMEDNLDNMRKNVLLVRERKNKHLQYLYEDEFRFISQVKFFAIICMIITIIGVFSLTMFETEYRRKEIGIRKVMGSSVGAVVGLFVARYTVPLVLSFVVAAPVGYWLCRQWLQSFAEHTPLYWWLFPLSFVCVSVVVIATVAAQSWKVATENPVESIKTE